MSEEKGIKELKELIIFIAALANAGDKASQDGMQLADMAEFIAPLMKAPDAFSGIEEAKLEMANLSQEEIQELNAALAKELDLVDDKLEGLVEKSLGLLVQIYGLIEEIKVLKKG